MSCDPAGHGRRGRILHILRSFRADHRGVAGIEFALVAGVLVILVLNGIEVARYAYTAMQVQNAAQVAAQSVWKACDPAKELPATTRCPGMNAAIAAAIGSTSLGGGVALQANSPTERYFCLSASNALVPAAGIALDSKPADCSTVPGAQAGRPGDYIKVDVTYAYTALFLDATVGRFFNGPITRTTYMRLL